ncbi:MAG: hypothetical protein FJ143_02940 [Deltaproteobacteria bacterium]|nr:hypothetical protein [Deltaproteobacteria bacterium]
MASTSQAAARSRAEALVVNLRARLGSHQLRDALSIFAPPLLALLGACYILARAAWISPTVALVSAFLTVGAAALAVTLGYRPRVPKLPQAAQLVDQRSGGKDHFLTLATVDPAHCSEPLLSRLRRDADDLSGRVELRRDFPYQVKPATFWSTGVSLILVLLLYFFLPTVGTRFYPPSASARLQELAEKMAQAPRLKELAEQLKTLAATLDDRKTPREEKQAAIEEVKQKIEQQQKKEPEEINRDLLSQAADELKGAEQQQSASGQEQQKNHSEGGGNLQSNLPKDSAGEAKQNQGSGGDGQGKLGTQQSKDMQQGKPAGENPKEPGQDKNQQQGAAQGNQPDPNRPGKDPNKDRAEKGQGGTKEGSGKNQASEEPPQSAPPAERFYRAGEGKEGLKGARYVTVQLPEDVVVESKGESKATKEATGNRARAQVPVSNTPLPAHLPNAPSEKQQMPIEYRGIIK